MSLSLSQRVERLSGRRETLIAQKVSLLSENSRLQGIVDDHPHVIAILSKLQEHYSQTSGQLYSELLTAIVHDVMKEQDQAIFLNTKMRNQNTELYITSEKHGVVEDIVRDRGGSINNLVSAGLRFIALTQSSHRRFVMLDESDCWIAEDLVPQFVEVLRRLCDEIGIQCLFVSHHDRELIKDKAEVMVVLHKNNQGKVCAEHIINEQNSFQKNESFNAHLLTDVGIRFIRLQNFMSHQDTQINLAKGLTGLVGDNDLGKSVILRAMDAVLHGYDLDAYIKHNESIGIVEIGLENEMELHYAINKKRGTKPVYTLLNAEKQVVYSDVLVDTVPDWVHEYLAMPDDSAMNLHIAHQKDPLFILNPAISPKKRAELIELGSEFEAVQSAIEKQHKRIKDAKQLIKINEKSLDTFNKELEVLRTLNVVSDLLSLNMKDKQAINADRLIVEEAKKVVPIISKSSLSAPVLVTLDQFVMQRDDSIQQDIFLLNRVSAIPDAITQKSSMAAETISALSGMISEYRDVELIKHDIDLLKQAARITPLKQCVVSPQFIQSISKLLESDEIVRLKRDEKQIQDLSMCNRALMGNFVLDKKTSVALGHVLASPFKLKTDINDWMDVRDRLIGYDRNMNELVGQRKEVELLLAVADQQIADEIEGLGGVCPLCNQVINPFVGKVPF